MESVSNATPKTKPAYARGARSDPDANGNQHVSSPRDVKTIPTQNENGPSSYLNENHLVLGVDVNNNVCFLPAPQPPRQD